MSQTVLSLKNVTIYQDKNPVLTDVNIDVKHGEFLYLIGRTGSGKSSFLKTLYADLALTDGEGSIVDYDLKTLVSDKNGKLLSNFTEKEGLSNNSVRSILEDKSGNLWFGTVTGLSKLTNEKKAEITEKTKRGIAIET